MYAGKVEAGRYIDFLIRGGEENVGWDTVRVRSRNGGRAQVQAKVGGRARI